MTTDGVHYTALKEAFTRVDTRLGGIEALLKSLVARTSRPSKAQGEEATPTLVNTTSPTKTSNEKVTSFTNPIPCISLGNEGKQMLVKEARVVEVPMPMMQEKEVLDDIVQEQIGPQEQILDEICPKVQIQSAPPRKFKVKVLIFLVHSNKGDMMSIIALPPEGETPLLHADHGQWTKPFDPGRLQLLPRKTSSAPEPPKEERAKEFNQGMGGYAFNYMQVQFLFECWTTKDIFMPPKPIMKESNEGPNLDLEDKVGFKGGGIVGTSPYAPKAPDKTLVQAEKTQKDPYIKLAEGPETGPGNALETVGPKITQSDLPRQNTSLGKSGSVNMIEIAKEWDDITKPEERPKELAGTNQSAYTRLGDVAGKAGLGGNTPSTRKGTWLGIYEDAPGQIHGTRPSIDEAGLGLVHGTRLDIYEDSLGQVNTQSFMHLTGHNDTQFMYGIYEELTKDHDQEMSIGHGRPRRMNPCARSVHPPEGMNPSQSMNQALMAIHLLKLAFMAHALASPSPI
ncbi:hypothetical protein QQ045_029204 [Rhodiola kirilowii]